jgi:hypothetical protein
MLAKRNPFDECDNEQERILQCLIELPTPIPGFHFVIGTSFDFGEKHGFYKFYPIEKLLLSKEEQVLVVSVHFDSLVLFHS